MVQTAQDLVRKGYLMATGGNISMRVTGQDAFGITPSNFDYMRMKPEDVPILDFGLNSIVGARKPSVESGMHEAIYLGRGDVNIVIHTHQVYASALAYLLAICSEREVSKIPLAAREIAFAKLRKDQKKIEAGDFETGGE